MSLFLTNYNTHLSMNTRVNTLVYNIFLHVLFQISTNVRNWRYVVIQQPVRTLWIIHLHMPGWICFRFTKKDMRG